MELTKELEQQIKSWNGEWKDKRPEEVLKHFISKFDGTIALASSLGAEDQVITDMIVKTKPCRIFTLDTGRLFPETYEVMDKTNKKYGINIEVFFPDKEQVEAMVNAKGINLFYDSVENRKNCCGVRKVEPLQRAFSGMDAWICGLRKDQTVTRFFTELIEWDEVNQLIKINPLLSWTEKEVYAYLKKNDVPYNALHDKGFVSIGCQPCTRAIEPGEDFRAGRWWWENQDQKECGLHKR